ncbi:hypothetical protein R5R35_011906 [Gryllus longicercus]|uniref:RING-type E3 ubiquitin transferase n=1 Tax=Gryllus longicercus TaxID=2509291 RepID=A0AAN9VZD1_9ORTH
MPNTAEDTIRYLMRLLECPVCLEPMSSPIEQCPNGHFLCHECRALTETCPTCGRRLKGYRNRLAEEFSMYLLAVQCPFSLFGCTKTVFPKDLKVHQEGCCFRPYECKICKSQLPLANIQHHFSTVHPLRILTLPVLLDVELDSNGRGHSVGCAIIAAHGRLFWFWRHLTEFSLFVGVQNCDGAPPPTPTATDTAAAATTNNEEAPTFMYRVKISDTNGHRELCFTGPVHPDGPRQSELVEQGKCFGVSRRFLLNLLDSGVVQIKLNVYAARQTDNA